MEQLADRPQAYDSLALQADAAPTTVQITTDAIEQLRASQIDAPNPVSPNTYHEDQKILDWKSPFIVSKGFIRKFNATGDVEDLARAQEFARMLSATRKDGEIATSTIGRKWDALISVNEAMKSSFGIVDAADIVELKDVAQRLGKREIDDRTSKLTPWGDGDQLHKAARYTRLAVLTETPEDEQAAYDEVRIIVEDIKANGGAKTVGQIPFTVDSFYRLGRVEEARQLVDDYLAIEGTQSHYIVEPLLVAAVETQAPNELELALKVIKTTLEGNDEGHTKGLRTKYGTWLSGAARELGNYEVAYGAAELISNPQRREQVLGRLATSVLLG